STSGVLRRPRSTCCAARWRTASWPPTGCRVPGRQMPETRSIREAWSKIPSPGEVGVGLERFTGQRMERILAVVAAIGSAALGARAMLNAISRLERLDGPHLAIMIMVFGPLVWMILACVTGRWVKQAAGSFAVLYVLALLLWPAVVVR